MTHRRQAESSAGPKSFTPFGSARLEDELRDVDAAENIGTVRRARVTSPNPGGPTVGAFRWSSLQDLQSARLDVTSSIVPLREPLDRYQSRKMIAQILPSGEVVLFDHCKDELAMDDLDIMDAINV